MASIYREILRIIEAECYQTRRLKLFSMRERERKRGRRSDEVDGEVILFYNVEKAV
jgi:hypothetical protein